MVACLVAPQPAQAYSVLSHDEIARLMPGVNERAFVFTYTKQQFEREFGRDSQRPGLFARFLAYLKAATAPK